HDGHAVPVGAQGPAQGIAFGHVVAEPFGQDQALSEGEGRSAPVVVVGAGVEHDGAAGEIDMTGEEPAGVEVERHRMSRRSRSSRNPAHTLTVLSGAPRSRRPGGWISPRAARSSRVRASAPASMGPSWATGRPSTVITMRSPAPARRTAVAVWLRNCRTPMRSTAGTVA